MGGENVRSKRMYGDVALYMCGQVGGVGVSNSGHWVQGADANVDGCLRSFRVF